MLNDVLDEYSEAKAGLRYLKCCAYILGRYREKPRDPAAMRTNLRLLIDTVTMHCVEVVVDDLLTSLPNFSSKQTKSEQTEKQRSERKRLSDDAFETLGVFQSDVITEMFECVTRKPSVFMSDDDEYEIAVEHCKIGMLMAILFDLESYAISAVRNDLIAKNPIFAKK